MSARHPGSAAAVYAAQPAVQHMVDGARAPEPSFLSPLVNYRRLVTATCCVASSRTRGALRSVCRGTALRARPL